MFCWIIHCTGKLWCVFGCGGDRDEGKRREMGEIASALADRLIITNDNPRFEEPEKIVNDIIEGIRDANIYSVELSRRLAIKKAITEAGQADVVLIAGKGHESYQEICGFKEPFSDLATVERYTSTTPRG